MKFRAVIGCVVITLVVLVWISPAVCQTDDRTKMRTLYAKMIDNCIKKCKSKAAWSDSRSENIRKAAALASIKMKYLSTYRDNLIQQMIAKEIQLKSYKIQYFLNTQFYIYYAANQNQAQDVLDV
jgi:hypothetical protein